MKASPSFQFYPSDWLRDPGLRSCSLAARGLWIDMISFMHEADPYGHLRLNGRPVDAITLARMVGSDVRTVRRLLSELEAAGVFSRAEAGTIFSRRMVRDQQLRDKRGQYGYLSQQHPDVPKRKDTLHPSIRGSLVGSPSSSYSGSSSSSAVEKRQEPPLSPSEGDFEVVWNAYPRREAKAQALKAWNKLKSPPVETMLQAIAAYAKSDQWRREGGRFIPLLARWLDDHRWEDEMPQINGHTAQAQKPAFPGPEDPIGRRLWRLAHGNP